MPSLVPVPCSPNRASTSITPCTNSISRRHAAAKLLMVHPAALKQNINKLNIFGHANAAVDFDDDGEEEDYKVDDDDICQDARKRRPDNRDFHRPTNSTTPKKAADRGLEIPAGCIQLHRRALLGPKELA